MGFDGIAEVVLPIADRDPLLALYVDLLAFTVHAEEANPDPRLREVWALPAAPRRTTLLGKPGSTGGRIRLVEVPGLPEPLPAGRPDREGAYALDFFLRHPETTEARVESGGFPYRSPAADYPLPAHPDVTVHERILDQLHSGLIHATIGYRDGGTRCVLDDDPRQDVSEVVAVVFASHSYSRAVDLVGRVLGGTAYLHGEFGGRDLERLLLLDTGERLPMTLFRGPRSRNARLEVCDARPPREPRAAESVPRATATCRIEDLDTVASVLGDEPDVSTTGLVSVTQDGKRTRRLGLRAHGLSLDLVEQ